MARGGRRQSSGRIPLSETARCGWIVDAVREEIEHGKSERHARWIKRHLSGETGAREELEQCRAKLLAVPVSERAAVIADPVNTPLEDIQAIFDEGQVSRWTIAPAPSDQDMGSIYQAVAIKASQHFRARITKDQVRRCMNSWRTLEARLKSKSP